MTKHLFLTGQPGVGKSTLVAKVLEQLHASGLPRSGVQGFYTADVRQGGERIGFDILTVDPRPQQGPLARVGSAPKGVPSVGKYVVDVPSIERLAVPALRPAGPGTQLIVCDEVGKMELACPGFFDAVLRALDAGPPVLGTVPVPRYGRTIPQAEQVKARADVEVVTVTKANRDELAAQLAARLARQLGLREGGGA